MSSNYDFKKITRNYAQIFVFWLAVLHLHVLADSLDKGLKLQRSPKISSIHELEESPESLALDALKPIGKEKKRTVPVTTGQYEIRTVSGEPNYHSVNLTWDVELVSSSFPTHLSINSSDGAVSNSSFREEQPVTFQIFYCELQSLGPQRCRSKSVNSSQKLTDQPENNTQLRHYTAQIGNLRMATKYSFHIRPLQNRNRSLRITGRSETFNTEVDETNELTFGSQTIYVPTKGFSAQATKCLPHASEIEIETGPHFGGKIVVDDSNCVIKGNPNDPVEKYTMRIDHKLCGSLVKPETNTVETFITVQENLGIFTHSTRRFVVVCTFQTGMQTVRASFTVPGKEGVAAALEIDPFEPDERMGREHKQMRFVSKSALIMKEQSVSVQTTSEETIAAIVEEVQNPAVAIVEGNNHAEDAVIILEDIIPEVNKLHINNDNKYKTKDDGRMETMKLVAHARLAKLFADQNEPKEVFNDETYNLKLKDKSIVQKSILQLSATNVGSVILTISLCVIIIGVLVYVVLRETRRQAFNNANSMRAMQQK